MPYSSLPSISRDDLCAAAKKIPQAGCIVDGFCPAAKNSLSSGTTESSELALIEQIIADLGNSAIGQVDVQPAPVGTSSVSISASISTSSSTSTTSSEGRAVGLCGKYYCVGGK